MATKKALDRPSYSGFWLSPSEILIETDPGHPLYDPQAVQTGPDDRIARNYLAFGVIVEVQATKREDGKVVTLDGRHRIVNARRAEEIAKAEGLDPPKVKVFLRKDQDEGKTLAAISLATDVRKKPDHLREAQRIQHFMSLGYTVEDAALALAVSKATIQNRLALLELSPEVQKAVKSGIASPNEALALKDKTPEEQKAAVEQLKTERTETVTDEKTGATKTVVKKTKKAKAKPGPKLIQKIYEDSPVDEKIQAVLGWVLGKVSQAKVAELVRGFPAPEKKAKKAKKETAHAAQ